MECQQPARPLADSPFATALRAAIQARGLSLDRIRDRLLGRGFSVSLATLSYWQSGRSRPERRGSLAVLAHLEEVLEVPAGSLAALLGPPRPRGRWLSQAPANGLAFGALWPHPDRISDAVRDVDTRWDERLTRLSQHDLVAVGANREELTFTSRQVLRAEADGADRWVVVAHIDEHDRPLPLIRPLRHCRLGRVVVRPEDGLLVAELLFDQPLARGETIITEHMIANRAPYPLATNYNRKFRLPVREYVLEIDFHAGAVPRRCVRYAHPEGRPEQAQRVTPGPGRCLHGVALNFGPGCFGFRWEWT